MPFNKGLNMNTTKELSIQTCDIIFKQNRVKSYAVMDGEFCFYLNSKGVLYGGSMCHCDTEGCPCFGFVNTSSIDAINTPESALLRTPFVHSKHNVQDAIGCYDDDGSGDVLCPNCRAKREAISA